MNGDAQKYIGNALSQLMKSKNIEFVALEGAFGAIDLSVFQTYSEPHAVKAAADFLLRENKISGAIHALLVSHSAVNAIGIDDETHYRANVEAYRRSAPLIPSIKKQLVEQEKRLAEKKKNIFNSQLAAFDAQVAAYHGGVVSMANYVRALLKYDSMPTSNIRLYEKCVALENALDFSRVEAQRTALLAVLTKRLSENESAGLLTATADYRKDRLRHADFYGYLKKLCTSKGISLTRYPAMDDYLRYVTMSDAINAEKLLTDMRVAEASVYEQLARSSDERALVTESRQLYLIGRLVDFSLTREEWKEIKKIRRDAQSSLRSFEDFYERAELRDEAMARNLLNKIQRTTCAVPNTVVLVTGGFHSAGIDQRLVDAGCTVVSFVPKISHLGIGSASSGDSAKENYLSVFTQQKSPLDLLFEGNRLFLSPEQWTPAIRGFAGVLATASEIRFLGNKVSQRRIENDLSRLTGIKAQHVDVYRKDRMVNLTVNRDVRVKTIFDSFDNIADVNQEKSRWTGALFTDPFHEWGVFIPVPLSVAFAFFTAGVTGFAGSPWIIVLTALGTGFSVMAFSFIPLHYVWTNEIHTARSYTFLKDFRAKSSKREISLFEYRQKLGDLFVKFYVVTFAAVIAISLLPVGMERLTPKQWFALSLAVLDVALVVHLSHHLLHNFLFWLGIRDIPGASQASPKKTAHDLRRAVARVPYPDALFLLEALEIRLMMKKEPPTMDWVIDFFAQKNRRIKPTADFVRPHLMTIFREMQNLGRVRTFDDELKEIWDAVIRLVDESRQNPTAKAKPAPAPTKAVGIANANLGGYEQLLLRRMVDGLTTSYHFTLRDIQNWFQLFDERAAHKKVREILYHLESYFLPADMDADLTKAVKEFERLAGSDVANAAITINTSKFTSKRPLSYRYRRALKRGILPNIPVVLFALSAMAPRMVFFDASGVWTIIPGVSKLKAVRKVGPIGEGVGVVALFALTISVWKVGLSDLWWVALVALTPFAIIHVLSQIWMDIDGRIETRGVLPWNDVRISSRDAIIVFMRSFVPSAVYYLPFISVVLGRSEIRDVSFLVFEFLLILSLIWAFGRHYQANMRRLQNRHVRVDAAFAKKFARRVRYVSAYGKPGAGKGTILKQFIAELNSHLPANKQYVVLTMGDIFRALAKKRKGEDAGIFDALTLPESAVRAMESGKIIDDAIALDILNEALKLEPFRRAYGIIFDGFPRSSAQLDAHNQGKVFINERPLHLDFNFILDIEDATIRTRAEKRRSGEIQRADREGRAPQVRPDDAPEKVEARIVDFNSVTRPAVERKRGDADTIVLNGELYPKVVYRNFLLETNHWLDKQALWRRFAARVVAPSILLSTVGSLAPAMPEGNTITMLNAVAWMTLMFIPVLPLAFVAIYRKYVQPRRAYRAPSADARVGTGVDFEVIRLEKSPLPLEINVPKNIWRQFSPEAQQKIIRAATWQDRPLEKNVQGRTIRVYFDAVESVNGVELAGVELKGLVWKDPKTGRIQPPRMERYFGGGRRASVMKFDRWSRPVFVGEKDAPQGAMTFDYAAKEWVSGHKLWSEAMPIDLPIGFGKLIGPRSQFFDGQSRKDVGFAIRGIRDVEEKRLLHDIGDRLSGLPFDLERPAAVDGAALADIDAVAAQKFREFGRLLRYFHDRGFIHGSPHTDNVVVDGERSNFKDLNTVIEEKKNPRDQAIVLQLFDLSIAWTSLLIMKRETESLLQHRLPIEVFWNGYFGEFLKEHDPNAFGAMVVNFIHMEATSAPLFESDSIVTKVIGSIVGPLRQPDFPQPILASLPDTRILSRARVMHEIERLKGLSYDVYVGLTAASKVQQVFVDVATLARMIDKNNLLAAFHRGKLFLVHKKHPAAYAFKRDALERRARWEEVMGEPYKEDPHAPKAPWYVKLFKGEQLNLGVSSFGKARRRSGNTPAPRNPVPVAADDKRSYAREALFRALGVRRSPASTTVTDEQTRRKAA